MSELTNNEQQVEQVQDLPNPFSEESWVDPVSKTQPESTPSQSQSETQSEAPVQTSSSSDDYDLYDPDEYIKDKLGFSSFDEAAQEIERLKKGGSLEFENETSRKFYEYAKEQKEEELINFLQEKKKIERLASAEIKDEKTAEEIVKLSMYQKNRDLDQEEVDFLFNEKFNKPAKPEQRFDELDSEYEQRVSDWERKVNEVNKRLVIEAKLARPELEKIKESLVLPDINPQTAERQLTQEELEAQRQYMDYYYGSVNNVVNSFDGFSVTVKDEGADFTVNYVPSEEERRAVGEQLKYFAENNLDANMLFADRWVNDDNTINVEQMTRDLLLLQNDGKIAQKYVNEAANKKLAMHLKKQSNITIGETTPSGTFDASNRQTEMDKLAAIMFAK